MLDYIHSAETEQFSFLRVPKILLQNDTFKGISAEAKLLYSIGKYLNRRMKLKADDEYDVVEA